MSKSSPSNELPVRRFDRILAFMSLGLALLSIICFFAIIISSAAGLKHGDYAQFPWPIVSAVMYFALPVAFVLLLILIFSNMARRSRG